MRMKHVDAVIVGIVVWVGYFLYVVGVDEYARTQMRKYIDVPPLDGLIELKIYGKGLLWGFLAYLGWLLLTRLGIFTFLAFLRRRYTASHPLKRWVASLETTRSSIEQRHIDAMVDHCEDKKPSPRLHRRCEIATDRVIKRLEAEIELAKADNNWMKARLDAKVHMQGDWRHLLKAENELNCEEEFNKEVVRRMAHKYGMKVEG